MPVTLTLKNVPRSGDLNQTYIVKEYLKTSLEEPEIVLE